MDRTQRLPDDTGVTGDIAPQSRVQSMYLVKFVRLDSLPAPETILSAGELRKYDSFRFKKRKREWLGGRTAAKKLVLESVLKNHNTDPGNIVISYDKYGRPVCSSIPLSISHCSDYAAAAMVRPAKPSSDGDNGENYDIIGIDLEKIQKRSCGWIEESFHDCELYPEADRKPEQTTALWTQKEAVLKALGLGLTCSLRDVKITNSVPRFTGKALLRWQELKSPHLVIITEPKPDGYILSTALGYGRISNPPGGKND